MIVSTLWVVLTQNYTKKTLDYGESLGWAMLISRLIDFFQAQFQFRKQSLETQLSLEETFPTVAVECSRMFQNPTSMVSEIQRALIQTDVRQMCNL